MAYERDDYYDRRRQRQARQARARRRNMGIFLGILVLCLAVGGFFLVRAWPDSGETVPSTTAKPPVTLPPLPAEPETVIRLTFGGDVNVTDSVIASGDLGGKYDFGPAFMDVWSLFAQSDASVLNFEGNVAGSPYGSATTSAPRELLEALRAGGIDYLQMANSCAINNGLTGLRATLDAIRASGMEPLGAFASNELAEEAQGFTIQNIGGIRVAFVAFTKGVGSLGLPDGSEKCVNLLYKDYATTYQQVDTEGITAILQAVALQEPDITVALLHWGSEYNATISASQEKIAKLMTDNGVDAIIGTHSHYVQPVTYDEATGQLIAYSLGDFYGDAQKNGTNYSVILELEITRDNRTGQTRITAWDYEPIYTLTPERDGEPMRLVRLHQAMEMYENNHVHKVSKAAYENMKSALEKIQSRMGK